MYSAGCYPAELELFQKRTLLARPSPFVCLYLFIHLFIYYLSNLYLFTYSLICLKKVTFLGGEEGGTHKSVEYDLCLARADTDSDTQT